MQKILVLVAAIIIDIIILAYNFSDFGGSILDPFMVYLESPSSTTLSGLEFNIYTVTKSYEGFNLIWDVIKYVPILILNIVAVVMVIRRPR